MIKLFDRTEYNSNKKKIKASQNLQKILDTIAAILGSLGLAIATIEVSIN